MITNQEIKRLMYLMGARFFALQFDERSDSVLLDTGEYRLWYGLHDNQLCIYQDGMRAHNHDRDVFLDILFCELSYRIENGDSLLEAWVTS